MTQKNDPFIGSNWGWDEGENGWGLGLNETLIQLAFLQNRRIDGIVSSLPETPADGEAYFLTLDKRVYFRVDGSWYGSDVPEGMDFILKSTEERYEFDGTTLTPVVVISDAVDVDYNNSVSGLTANNVQDAVDELVEELSGKVDVVVGKQLSTEDYTTAEKNKLSGIEAGATANETDAYLLDRANHEGVQPQSTVENLVADLNSKQTIANLVQDLSSPNSTTYLSTQGLASAFADIVAGEVYKGEWDADTNTPPLTSGVGVQGEYYQVSVAGNTNLDGISSWALGDEVLFDGTVWKKRANYQSVVSVNGQTGPVVLSASDVGAVSSIAMTVPTGLQVSGSPITSSGTLAVTFQSGYSIPTNANQANWTIAYNERNRWDGGSTGLNAATGRTSLGLGTASQANLVTSSTDTTAGSVLTTGYAGLYTDQAVAPAGTSQDNNARVTFALTRGSGQDNRPSWIEPSTVHGVFILPVSTGRGMQITFSPASTVGANRVSLRTYTSGDFQDWVDLWHTGNLVKTTSATDATAGRMLQTGDGGISGNAVNVTAPDDISASCLFEYSLSNRPAGVGPAGAGQGIHVAVAGSSAGLQIFGPRGATLSSARLFYRTKSSGTWNPPNEFYTTGNTSADVQTMLSSSNNDAIRSNIGAARKLSVANVSTSSHFVTAGNESIYHRFTFNGAKTATVRPNSTHALPADGSWVLRNVGTGNLTIVAGSGVIINPPHGGTLVMEPGMTVTLQKVGTNEYDLVGQTVPA